VKRIIAYCLCLSLVLFPVMTLRADACTTAYFGFVWDVSVNTKSFSLRFGVPKYFGDSYLASSLNAWNDISSQIRIGSITLQENNADANDKDINFHENELTGSAIGLTHLYRKTLLGYYVETLDVNREVIAQVRIDLSPTLSTLSPQWRGKTITHELGHAIGLCHPTDKQCRQICVMQQGQNGIASATVTQHDRNNVVAKWGN